jgi:chromodomain-helicase-DNA-binding protein 7
MVKIYRLVTKNTYEREMFDRAGLKLGLDKAVLQSMNTNLGGKDAATATSSSNSLSKAEVENLLKKGAYGALMDDDNAGDKFCEEDIEDILMRRATTITHQEEKGSTFSKASFTTADSATDISIDDPDFWKKWAKKAEIEEIDETMKLMMVEPRNRKRVDRLGNNPETVDPNTVSDLDSSSDSDGGGGGGEKASSRGGGETAMMGGRSREQRIKDKHKSLKQQQSLAGGKSRRSRRGAWEEDEDFMEDERDVEYGSWTKNELFR